MTGRPTYLDNSKLGKPTVLAEGAGMGCSDIFSFPIISLFFSPLDIDWHTISKNR